MSANPPAALHKRLLDLRRQPLEQRARLFVAAARRVHQRVQLLVLDQHRCRRIAPRHVAQRAICGKQKTKMECECASILLAHYWLTLNGVARLQW